MTTRTPVAAARTGAARLVEWTRSDLPPAARAAVVATLAIAVGSLFLASYTLALGDPVPRRIDTAVVGNASSHRAVLDEIEKLADGGVDFHPYPTLADATGAIDRQQVYAALDLTQPTPRLYVASASGASVERVFLSVAAADPQLRIVDTRPLPPSDPEGLDVFYLVMAATVLGFLTVFQVRLNAGGLSLRRWTVFVLSFGLAASLVLVLVAGPLLHRLALPVLESWGILALQLITVAAFASAMAVLIGRWAILPTFLLFMVVGNPSSGGAVAPPLLPSLFGTISPWMPSGATVTALRAAIYFPSYQHVHPVAVLAVWAVVCLGAMLVVSHRRRTSPGIT
jgi:hypothetical protein